VAETSNTYTYDLGTDIGRVRLMIGDTSPINGKRLFSNEEIDAYLDMYESSIRLASAAALDTIASSEALLRKKIGTSEFSIDAPAVAREIRNHAKQLRLEHVEVMAIDGGFDYAEINYGQFSSRRLRLNDVLRGL
jgi:hypothetical protein